MNSCLQKDIQKADEQEIFLSDVISGLHQKPEKLYSKYFYDDKGPSKSYKILFFEC